MSARLSHKWWLSAIGLLVALVSLVPGSAAQAQVAAVSSGTYGPPPYYGYGGGGFGGGGYGWGGLGAGSTAAGSYMSGMAQAIRAQGQYNLMTSQAAINAEEAAKRDIENRQRWTSTYFEMRKINDAYKQAQRAPPTPPEEWVRLAQIGIPQRLNSSVLDPVTGHIGWPIVLTSPEFAEPRQELDQLFADRAISHGAIGIDAHGKIRQATDDMLELLKGRIRDLDSRNYLDARNFLSSLAREADYPTGSYSVSEAPPARPPAPPRPSN